MNTTKYSSAFESAIELAKKNDLFLGSGNPSATILIIGKEAAIDKVKSKKQYEQEYLKNIADWEQNFSALTQFENIDNWFIQDRQPLFNSLYPYKGQKNTVESRNGAGDIIRGHFGTSKTWHNYQKIIESIYFNGNKNETINFHEYAFCSEFNQETGKYSKDLSKKIRSESIEKRKELFQKAFFRAFPITIVAVGHYVRDFNIDLQNLFKMKFHEGHSNEFTEGLKKEYINVHYDDLEKPTKLLIHTNQLSMVSNNLIHRLGQICNDFSKTNQIT